MSGIPVAGGLLGQLAGSRGLVSPDQLKICLEILTRDGNKARLGDIFVSQGLLTAAQVQALLADQAALQARLRESGPMGAPAAGSGLELEDAARSLSAGQQITKVSVAKKTAAQVEAEIAAQKAAM